MSTLRRIIHFELAGHSDYQEMFGGAPVILYTDIVAGPTSGGENNKGCYLSIFGFNFGLQAGLGSTTKVYVGDAEVDNYRALIPAKVAPMFNPAIQHIVVQVGSLGGLAAGASGAIKVSNQGIDSNLDHTFMNQPGPIYFVDETNGSDNGDGSIGNPLRLLQSANPTTTKSGITPVLNQVCAPGSYIVLRGGTWTGIGVSNQWCSFAHYYTYGLNPTGNAPTGAAGHGYVTVTAHPGTVLGHAIENVHYVQPAGGYAGGFRSCDQTYAKSCGLYLVISNLRIENDESSVDGPVDFQSSADWWRVVNCELGPWPGTAHRTAGGIAGNGVYIKVLGNYIHDIANPGTGNLENHGMYFDGSEYIASYCEIAYNWVKDSTGGSGIQFYNSVANGNFVGMTCHHNHVDTTAKYGINVADSAKDVQVWNNVVRNPTSYGLRTHVNGGSPYTISLNHNTVYGGSYLYGNSDGSNFASDELELKNNIFIASATGSCNGWVYNGGTIPAGAIDNNLYYDPQNRGGLNSKYSGDAHGIYGDPKVTTEWTDFRVQLGSPAINAGSTTLTYPADDDFDSRARPQPGNSHPTIGAFEAP